MCQPSTRSGVLKEADRAVLVCFCECWSTYVTAIRQVRAEGVTVVNPETHCPRKNPALAAAEAAANQLRSLGNELGLSPAAERLLNIAPHADADDDDPFA